MMTRTDFNPFDDESRLGPSNLGENKNFEQMSSPINSNGRVFIKNAMSGALFEIVNRVAAAISNLSSHHKNNLDQITSLKTKPKLDLILDRNNTCLPSYEESGYFDTANEIFEIVNENTDPELLKSACDQGLSVGINYSNGVAVIHGSTLLRSKLESMKANNQPILIKKSNKISEINKYNFNELSEEDLMILNRSIVIYLIFLKSERERRAQEKKDEPNKANEETIASFSKKSIDLNLKTEKTNKIDPESGISIDHAKKRSIMEMKFLLLMLVERILVERKRKREEQIVETKITDRKTEILKTNKKNHFNKNQVEINIIKFEFLINYFLKSLELQHPTEDTISIDSSKQWKLIS